MSWWSGLLFACLLRGWSFVSSVSLFAVGYYFRLYDSVALGAVFIIVCLVGLVYGVADLMLG